MHIDRRLALISAAVGSIVVLAGCGAATTSRTGNAPTTNAPASTPSTASVSDWMTSVSTDYSAVANDWTTIAAQSGADLSGIIAACTQLSTDVQTLQSDAPLPNPTMNPVYQDALTNSALFATGCVNAATDVSASELEAAGQYQTKALSDFDQLNGMLTG